MTHRPVHHAVYDTYADWETGHATAYLARAGYEIRTVGPGREPVTSIGACGCSQRAPWTTYGPPRAPC